MHYEEWGGGTWRNPLEVAGKLFKTSSIVYVSVFVLYLCLITSRL